MKALSIFLTSCLVLSIFALTASGQQQDTSAFKRTISALEGLHRRAPLEKIYLHTDRNSYLIGDTIWFKAYVFDAHTLTPTENSALLFIELHDDQSEVVRRFSTPIKRGTGATQLTLDREIFKEGGYTLRAYTNWMNNFDTGQTFSKRISIGKATEDSWLISSDIKLNRVAKRDELDVHLAIQDIDKNPVGLRDLLIEISDGDKNRFRKSIQTDLKGNLHFKHELRENSDQRNMSILLQDLGKNAVSNIVRIPLETKRLSTLDLQFLPEGGNLVAGLKSRVAFKAITDNGKGTQVEGVILDQHNKQVGSFKSLHSGMGNFIFQPQAKDKYTARVTKPEGIEQTLPLPEIEKSGTTLHIENPHDQDSVTVTIDATAGIFESTGSLTLIGSSSGVVYFGNEVSLENKTIRIAKSLFPSGIVRFSLLKGETPLNERIIFIDHQDNLKISIMPDIDSDEDNVSFKVQVNDAEGKPVVGNFSLSITDNSIIGADTTGNSDIRTSLLLNAELKGEVEDPGYYFSANNKAVSEALDNLMLTQGWVGYQWQDVFKHPTLRVQAEKPGNVVNIKQIYFDKASFLRLKPWYLDGDAGMFLFAKSAILHDEYWSTDGTMLKEVKIRSRKRDYSGVNRNGVGYADIVLDSTDLQLSKTKGLYDLLQQKVPGLTIEQEYDALSNRKGYNLRIDGRWVRIQFPESPQLFLFLKKTGQDLKNEVNRTKVASLSMVEIMYSQKYLNKYYPPKVPEPFKPGAKHKRIESRAKAGIATENHDKDYAIVALTGNKKKTKDPNPLSLELTRKFYVPKFGSDGAGPTVRPATVFWEPNVLTDVNGRSTISFVGRGLNGSFTVNVQGADMKGSVGSKIKRMYYERP